MITLSIYLWIIMFYFYMYIFLNKFLINIKKNTIFF